jgi:GNAT superfamily N-acetyltransferase
MWVREAIAVEVCEILAFVQAKAQFDRELGAFHGELGTNEELIRRHLFGSRPFAHVLFAGEQSLTGGYALCYFTYSSYRGRPGIWLDDLFVNESGRGKGLGRLLMRRLGEIALAEDCSQITWIASASNTVGMKFYRRLGASEVQQIGDTVTLQIEPGKLIEPVCS